jgi:hypothetical protein
MKRIWRKTNSQQRLKSLSKSQKKSFQLLLPILKMRSLRMVMMDQVSRLQMIKVMSMFSKKSSVILSLEKVK